MTGGWLGTAGSPESSTALFAFRDTRREKERLTPPSSRRSSLFQTALRIPEVALRLQVHPKFWCGSERLRQKNGSLRRDCPPVVNQQVDPLNGHAQARGEIPLSHLLWSQEFLAENFARRGGASVLGNHVFITPYSISKRP